MPVPSYDYSKSCRNIRRGLQSVILVGGVCRQWDWQSSLADEIARVAKALQVGTHIAREGSAKIWVAEKHDGADLGVERRGKDRGGFVDDLTSLTVGLLESLLLRLQGGEERVTRFLPEPGEYNLRTRALRCRLHHLVCHKKGPRITPTEQIIQDSRWIIICALHNHLAWPQRKQLIEEERANIIADVSRLRGSSCEEHDDRRTTAIEEFITGRYHRCCGRGGDFGCTERFECILK